MDSSAPPQPGPARSGDERCPRGGLIRSARRPAGWRAPGPAPLGPRDRADLWPGPGEDLCYLLGDWRIFQRTDGHRWSIDDLVTAAVAVRAMADRVDQPLALCDLGCGIGSVSMMLAWSMPCARLVGVEAQAISVDLARRSIAYNGAEDRVELRHGDMRDPAVIGGPPRFDLVTGTPPYFDPEDGVVSDLPQRGPCRFELRGGVEVYFEAAARILRPEGRFVVCEDARQIGRVEAAAARHGMGITDRLDLVPREGKPPLFSVFTCAPEAMGRPGRPPAQLVARDLQGRRPPAFQALRRSMGLPR